MIGKFIGTESKIVVTRGWGRWKGELGFNGDRVSVGVDGKVLETDGGDGCRTM